MHTSIEDLMDDFRRMKDIEVTALECAKFVLERSQGLSDRDRVAMLRLVADLIRV